MAGRISYYGGIVKDGLVLDLDAAKKDSYPGTGTTWRDLSGNNNNGTLINGPTFNAGNGGSIVFDGTNDYVTVPNNASLNSNIGTACVWFKYTSVNGPYPATLIGKHSAVSSIDGWNMYIDSSGTVAIQIKNNTGGNTISTSTPIYPTNTWCYASFAFSSGVSYNVYINGTLITSGTCISFNVSSDSLRLVDSADTFWGIMAGNIALAQVYNRVLSAAEILQNYNATKGRYGL